MYFQVVGFAITSPQSGQSVAYALSKPLPGVADPSQNTMQIDISRIGTAVSQAGYVDSSRVYDVLRIDPSIMIIELQMNYAGTQGYQTIFDVYSITMIPPDGRAQTFQMQQPTQSDHRHHDISYLDGRISADDEPVRWLLRTAAGCTGAGHPRRADTDHTADFCATAGAYSNHIRTGTLCFCIFRAHS